MAGWSFHGWAGPLKRPCGCLSLLRSRMSGVRRASCACTCPQRTLPRLLSQPSCALPTLQPLSVLPVSSPPICPSAPVHPPICPSVCPSICHLCAYPSFFSPTRSPVCVSLLPSVLPSLRPSSVRVSVLPLPAARLSVYTSVHLSIHLLIRLSTPPSCFHPSPVCLFHTSVGGWCPCGAGKLTASGPVRVWQ